MGVVAGQVASGTWTGTSFTTALPAASSASNRVVVFVGGNTTVTTLSGFTLRQSQVNFMGHYLFDAAGGATSYTWTCAAGQGTWVICEVTSGVHDISSSVNNTAGATSYATPSLTPTAGVRTVFASIGSVANPTGVRTIDGWTSSFLEQADLCVTTNDYPMQAVATLDLTAGGATAYATTGTYSASSVGCSAIIASYTTTSGVAAGIPDLNMAPRR